MLVVKPLVAPQPPTRTGGLALCQSTGCPMAMPFPSGGPESILLELVLHRTAPASQRPQESALGPVHGNDHKHVCPPAEPLPRQCPLILGTAWVLQLSSMFCGFSVLFLMSQVKRASG